MTASDGPDALKQSLPGVILTPCDPADALNLVQFVFGVGLLTVAIVVLRSNRRLGRPRRLSIGPLTTPATALLNRERAERIQDAEANRDSNRLWVVLMGVVLGVMGLGTIAAGVGLGS